MKSDFKEKMKNALKTHCRMMQTDPAYRRVVASEYTAMIATSYMRARGCSEDEIEEALKSHRKETAEYIKSMKTET